nr:hypothetical protein [Tanacetum cinerariifolium]
DIAREGYTLKKSVAELIPNGAWNWLISWLAKAPTISSIAVPLLRDHINKSKVWRIVCTFAGMESVPPRIDDIVDRLRPMAAKRTFKSIVVVQAVA